MIIMITFGRQLSNGLILGRLHPTNQKYAQNDDKNGNRVIQSFHDSSSGSCLSRFGLIGDPGRCRDGSAFAIRYISTSGRNPQLGRAAQENPEFPPIC